MKKWLLILLAVIILAIVWQTAQPQGGKTLKFSHPLSDSFTQSSVVASGFEKGGEWINSEPLSLAGLLADDRVKAVLVDFWTYSCINCRRTLPYLRSWWDKYKDKGLLIVGVHTPEFEFEKVKDNVVEATKKYGVTWPVVQDNDYGIWRDYQNNYWPRKYLINKERKIVYDHIGEGGYEETEKQIQQLLGVKEMELTKEPKAGGIAFGMKQTPELYVSRKGQLLGQIGKGRDEVELVGKWEVEDDHSQANVGARLRLEFQAGEVNLVMSSSGETQDLRVKVVVDGEDQGAIEVSANDLYNLWKGEFGRHTLEMSFDKGVRVHAFTFGK